MNTWSCLAEIYELCGSFSGSEAELKKICETQYDEYNGVLGSKTHRPSNLLRYHNVPYAWCVDDMVDLDHPDGAILMRHWDGIAGFYLSSECPTPISMTLRFMAGGPGFSGYPDITYVVHLQPGKIALALGGEHVLLECNLEYTAVKISSNDPDLYHRHCKFVGFYLNQQQRTECKNTTWEGEFASGNSFLYYKHRAFPKCEETLFRTLLPTNKK